MNIFQKYILKSLFYLTITISGILTFIIWLAQSLRYNHLISHKGISFPGLCALMSGLLPRIIIMTLPIGFLLALLWYYNRIIADKEKDGMSTFGTASWFFAWPAILLSSFLMTFLFFIGFYLVPKATTASKKSEYKVRYYLSPSFIVPGVFFHLENKILYVHRQKGPNVFEGIFIYDKKSPEKKLIITGKQAFISPIRKGISIQLKDGAHQTITSGKPPSILAFKNYILHLIPHQIPSREKNVEELSFRELENPSENVKAAYTREKYRRLFFPLISLCNALWATYLLLNVRRRFYLASFAAITIGISFQILLVVYIAYAPLLSILYIGVPIFLWGLAI
jgi:lipopolysaccharide export LptBFGC system permease protein LptF